MSDDLPMTKFPTEIWIHVVAETHLEKATLASISLVSNTLREIAQRELFKTIKFHYQSSLSTPFILNVDWSEYERKVQAICSSKRLCSFIQDLQIIFCNTIPWELHHNKFTDPVFCQALDDIISALPHMITLHRISYHAPFLYRNFHQVILLHPSIRKLTITPRTTCETPCLEASIRRGERHALRELEIAEWSPMEVIQGLFCADIGARRCALTSSMFITHALSLRKLRVPILLLYDAVVATSSLPDFPHLHSLSIMRMCPLMNLERMCGAILLSVRAFLLHVHETVVFLDWRPQVSFNPLEDLPSSCFPNLATLEGDGIESLLLGGRNALKRLRFFICEDRPDRSRNSIEALKECRSNSPELTTLCVHNLAHSMEYAPVVGEFTALKELSYGAMIPIGSDVSPKLLKLGATPPKMLTGLLHQFLASCLPGLPSIQTLFLDIWGTRFSDPMPLEEVILLADHLPNNSLEIFNFRLSMSKPEGSGLEKQCHENFRLRRVCDMTGGRHWGAPEGKVTTDDYVPCSVHMQNCRLNRPLGIYESWMTI